MGQWAILALLGESTDHQFFQKPVTTHKKTSTLGARCGTRLSGFCSLREAALVNGCGGTPELVVALCKHICRRRRVAGDGGGHGHGHGGRPAAKSTHAGLGPIKNETLIEELGRCKGSTVPSRQAGKQGQASMQLLFLILPRSRTSSIHPRHS